MLLLFDTHSYTRITHTLPPSLCAPILRGQETTLDAYKSRQWAEDLDEDGAKLKGSPDESHTTPLSSVTPGSAITASNALGLHPMNDLNAAGVAGTRDAGAAATSAQRHVHNTEAIANKIAVGAEEKQVPRATAVAAKAEASTTNRPNSLQDHARDGMETSPTGGGAGDDEGEFSFLFVRFVINRWGHVLNWCCYLQVSVPPKCALAHTGATALVPKVWTCLLTRQYRIAVFPAYFPQITLLVGRIII